MGNKLLIDFNRIAINLKKVNCEFSPKQKGNVEKKEKCLRNG